MDEKFKKAPAFYVIITLSISCGVLLDCFDINPMKALFWSAVVNGVLAPFLLAVILLIARDSKIMKNNPSSKLNQIMVFITMVLMFVAAVAMFAI